MMCSMSTKPRRWLIIYRPCKICFGFITCSYESSHMSHIIDWLIFVLWKKTIIIWRTWTLCCDCINKLPSDEWKVASNPIWACTIHLEFYCQLLILLNTMSILQSLLFFVPVWRQSSIKSIVKRLRSVKDINFLLSKEWTKVYKITYKFFGLLPNILLPNSIFYQFRCNFQGRDVALFCW